METSLNNEREKLLWKMAKKRVGFKRQLAAYLIVNAFLWAIWYFTYGRFDNYSGKVNIPWPLWSTLGWGVGVAFSFYGAYISDTPQAVEREFEKLKGKN